VQPGDTLYHIATSYGITTEQLQRANCLGSSTTIRIGQLLWVPNLPTLTPTSGLPFITPTFEPTEPFTETVMPYTSTPDPLATDVPTQPPASP
jgi:LysM repeat protein